MKIRILLIIIILALVLILAFNGCNRMKNNSEFRESSGNTAALTDTKIVLPDEIYLPDIPALLTELETGTGEVKNESLLTVIKEKSALGYYSNLIMANRYQSEGKNASEYYRSALKLYPTDEVRFKLASHLIKNGKVDEAENEYLILLSDETALQALIDIDTNPERISKSFLEKEKWKDAEEFLQPIVEGTSHKYREYMDDTILKRHYAVALVQQSEYKKALPFFKALYEPDKSDSEIAWWYGRCLEASGQTVSAKKIYSSIGEKGAYRLGIILQSEGRLMEAADVFNSSSEAISKWRASRIWDEADMLKKAIKTYIYIAERQSPYQDDAAYRAYILSKRLGLSDTGNLLSVLNKHPAWMVRIGMKPVMPELHEVVYEKPDFIAKAELYEKEGYSEAAEVELAITAKDASLEEKLALGDWYTERGKFHPAVLFGISSLHDRLTRRGYELAYPQAFEEIVIAASKEYNVEAALIWAVMREESHFRHEIVSWAGAMGLMQIMPSTGRGIASNLKINIKDEDLLKPEINIRFGTFYINSMLNMFDRDIDKAMAAYNGGSGNVKRWSQSKLGTKKEDFPTAITFFETQEYITKVKNSYYIYKWLYGI